MSTSGLMTPKPQDSDEITTSSTTPIPSSSSANLTTTESDLEQELTIPGFPVKQYREIYNLRIEPAKEKYKELRDAFQPRFS